MREDRESTRPETDIACALASFLLHVLILLVLCGSAWMLHSFIARPDSSSGLLREFTMYR
jgi:hypothetical protein